MNLMNLDPATRDYLIEQYRRAGDPAMARGVQLADMAVGAVDAYSGLTDDFVRGGQRALMGIAPNRTGAVARMAVNPAFKGALRALPAIGALSGVAAAGDILTGEESAANKAMDLTLGTAGAAGALKMGAMGAAAGSVVPGIGTVAGGIGGAILGGLGGFGLGKTASDVIQWVGGDKKTAEQRRMEEALAQLRGIG